MPSEPAPGGASQSGADRSADLALVERLLAGDEAAFADVVDRWSPAMPRIARGYVGNAHTAEDVVQDAWIGVLRGLRTYAGRSALRTWIFTIVANTAKASAEETCRALELSAANQRVLLHRGRAAVRAAIETYHAQR